MVNLKAPQEIEIMAQGGQMAAQVLAEAAVSVKVGQKTLAIDELVEKRIKQLGGQPSFQGFEGYQYSSCININDDIVHGIPNQYSIREGDLVSVDLGVFYKGFHADVAWTVLVGDPTKFPDRLKFLEVGEQALVASIDQCRPGQKIGDISSTMQRVVESAGFQVVRDLVGHGVGRELHEDPQVPCYGKSGTGLELRPGLVLAIEVIYTQGGYRLRLLEDGWTMATADGKLSGLFEATVAITSSHPRILTPLPRLKGSFSA